ncbi:FkbM family methyltransferase [Tamlana sp. 62-3]|uniref:FkbM family methyltransferase n=1 Tax=Neotamlana sargassicola TaxID=2883125 RepID=A0A9X1I6V5_9FLAO|nr:FkbM family methyltransferase [Tamlana sargassicola]MCB4808408.1 FkbM family methyltransferase [Tamlana sargassicola]
MNVRLFKVLNKLKVFKYLSFKKEITLNNKQITVPVYDNMGQAYLFDFEPWMLSLLNTISPFITNSFVDVGVNIGQTLLKVKSVSPTINYIGFEPNPDCYNYLKRLVALNNFTNTRIFQFGISNEVGDGALYFSNNSKTDPSASIVNGFRNQSSIKKSIDVPLTTWNSINGKHNFDTVSVLKIDVEGGELEVLNSFKSCLINDKPIIIIEILPTYTPENSFRINRQRKIEALLKELDYIIFRVIKKNNDLQGFKKLDAIEVHDNISLCDYVLVPKTKEADFYKCVKNFLNKVY